MVKRHNQHDPQKKRGTQLTLWIAIGGLIGLFLGFFIGILFGGMIFMPILAILGAAIGGNHRWCNDSAEVRAAGTT
jgi:uncharacterized membrane protein